MNRLVLEFLRLGIAVFFAGFLMAAEGVLLFNYYYFDTGILFTGVPLADLCLFLVGLFGMWFFGKDLYLLRRAVQAAIKLEKKRLETNEDD